MNHQFSDSKFPNDSWTRVEIFLRANDRLPSRMSDVITQETLDAFCRKYEAGELKSVTVDLGAIYSAIKRGEVLVEKKPPFVFYRPFKGKSKEVVIDNWEEMHKPRKQSTTTG